MNLEACRISIIRWKFQHFDLWFLLKSKKEYLLNIYKIRCTTSSNNGVDLNHFIANVNDYYNGAELCDDVV